VRAVAVLLAVAIVANFGQAMAASETRMPQFTTLDSCALKGRGVTLAGSDVCFKVTGGVYFEQSWGNAVGGDGTGLGKVIVVTPDDVTTIPMKRP